MSFDFSTLITDRSKADVETLKTLLSTPTDQWTTEQLETFNAAIMKGAYNYTDLNRVTEAMTYLDQVLQGYGYSSGFKPLEIQRSGGTVEPLLPEGYTQLEYIESTGAQYINSGYTPAWNTDVYMEAMIFKTPDFFALFGARNSSAGTDPNSNTLFISPQLNPRSDYYGSSYTFPNQLPVGVKFAVSVEQNLCDVYQYTYTHPKSTAASEYPLFVMDVNTAGSARGTGHCRLYSCSIYEGGIKIRDFIPCVNPSGEIGAFDLVGAEFYGNSGTGSFVAGPEVPPEPEPEPEPKDPYTWYETDVPTQSEMAQYLSNVLAVAGVFIEEPQLPQMMVGLTVDGANRIESALLELWRLIEILPLSFIPCGEALCGGDNL